MSDNRRVWLIPGTLGISPSVNWWRSTSKFSRRLLQLGYHPLSFEWTTALDGVIGKNCTWEYAGKRLSKSLRAGDSVVAHSHGGQVIAYALFYAPVYLHTVVTCGTPVRSDVDYYYHIVRDRSQWIHVYGSHDWWAILGALFDGRIALRRRMPLAHENIHIDGSHSDTHSVEVWDEHDIWRFL